MSEDVSATAQRGEGVEPAERHDPRALGARSRSEIGMCLLLLVLGGYLVIGARSITVPGSSNTVGPRAFPTMIGVLVAVVAIALAVRVWRGDRADADTSEDVDADAPLTWRPVGIVALAFAVHALLINVVGWPLAVTLMFTVVAWALGARTWWRSALVGGAVAVIVWIVFARLLGVALPGGTLLEAVTEWI
jgi:putative tricarboxylic transport membrane protein